MNTQHKPLRLALIALALSLISLVSNADTTQQGFDIAARSDRSDRGFGDSRVEMTMILRNAAGDETQRTLKLSTLEVPDEERGDKSLILFHNPPDIDGTALLSHAKILDPDDQWLYLPALKRVKRISSVNKSGPFVGSEFAFEDLTGQELRKYNHRYLRQEACGNLSCDVIERTPLYEHSGYTRQIVWIDRKVFQFRRIDYFDRRGDLLKSQLFDEYQEYSGYWRPRRIRMENHLNAKSTELRFGEWQFALNQKDGDFRKGVLKRLR
jgi:outer membrane lipoprotein-sorting protein